MIKTNRLQILSVKSVVATLLVIGVIGMSSISEETGIDIHTGRLRSRHLIGPVVLQSRVQETTFSRLASDVGLLGEMSEWHTIQSYSLWSRVSPHYQLHGIDYRLEEAMLACELLELTPESRKEVALRLLSALQRSDEATIDDTIDLLCQQLEAAEL